MPIVLRVLEGVQPSASFAQIVFRVNVADQMSAPTSASVEAVYDITAGSTVATTSVMPSGSASIEDTAYVKLPKLQSLTAGHQYSIRFSFSNADNKLPGEIIVDCKF